MHKRILTLLSIALFITCPPVFAQTQEQEPKSIEQKIVSSPVPFSLPLTQRLTLGDVLKRLAKEKNATYPKELAKVVKRMEAGKKTVGTKELKSLMPYIIKFVAPELLENITLEPLDFNELITRAQRIKDGCNQSINADVTKPVTKSSTDLGPVIALLCKIQKDIDECCELLCKKIENIDIDIDVIIDTITQCCEDLSEQIEECCDGIKRDIRECCDDLSDQLDDLSGQLDECCTDILEAITEVCQPCNIPIDSLPFTIDAPGSYLLRGTFEVAAGAGITITVDNVCLDLCCNTIIGTDNGDALAHVGLNGIVVDGGQNGIKNVTILNGTIDNMSSDGMFAQNVTNLQVKEVTASRCKNGFNLDACQDAVIDECVATCCTAHGFLLQGGNNPVIRAPFDKCEGCSDNKHNCVQNCKALSTRSSLNVYGFRSIGGLNNTFIGCVAKDTRTDDTTNAFVAAGFSLGVSESDGTFCADCGSKIIDCEVCDSTAEGNATEEDPGNGRPVGILFESAFDENEFAELDSQTVNLICSLSWSPDGCYVAVGSFRNLRMFKIEKQTGKLVQVDQISNFDNSVCSLSWSPDQCFLAVAGFFEGPVIFRVDKATGNLTEVDRGTIIPPADEHLVVAWSPDGCYLATKESANSGEINIFRVDKATGKLGNITDTVTTTNNLEATLSWSPDQCYLAADDGDNANVYPFNSLTGELGTVVPNDAGATVESVAWSPDACFLAAGRSDSTIRVFTINKATGNSLSFADAGDLAGSVESLSWSPDGKFLAARADVAGLNLGVFSIAADGMPTAELTLNIPTNNIFPEIEWSPDGCFIATIGENALVNFSSGLVTPQECTVKRNQISRSFGGCGGFGIIGLCSGNVEGEDPVTYTGHPSLFLNNQVFNADYAYTGVPNVYAKGFCGTPCPFDNVQFPPTCTQDQCDPVIDAINDCCTLLCEKIEDLSCGPVIKSLPAVITEPGSYTLIDTLEIPAGEAFGIDIQSDNVCLDLCCNTIKLTADNQSAIVAGGRNNITIKNGSVDGNNVLGSMGIQCISVTGLDISDINVSRIVIGITLIGCNGARVSACNVFETNVAYRIVNTQNALFEDCASYRSTEVGFQLLGSAAGLNQNNSFNRCSAISTGSALPIAIGFLSVCGRNNSFTNCVAKNTRTESADGVAVGFSFEGQVVSQDPCIVCQECNSKIVDCQVCDTTARDDEGLPFPLGRPVGIQLRPVLAECLGCEQICCENLDQNCVGDTTDVNLIKGLWSPDGCFFATLEQAADTDSRVSLFAVDKATNTCCRVQCLLIVCDQDQVSDATLFDLVWSPDSSCLAIAGKGTIMGNLRAFIMTFNPNVFTGQPADCEILEDCAAPIFLDPDFMKLAFSPVTAANGTNQLALSFLDKFTGVKAWDLAADCTIGNQFVCQDFTTACDGITPLSNPQQISAPKWAPNGSLLAITEIATKMGDVNPSARLRSFSFVTPGANCPPPPNLSCCNELTGANETAVLAEPVVAPDSSAIATREVFMDMGGGTNSRVRVFVPGTPPFVTPEDNCMIACTADFPGETITNLKYSPNGKFLLATTTGGANNVYIINSQTCGITCNETVTGDINEPAMFLNNVAWSPDSAFFGVVSVSGNPILTIFKVDKNTGNCMVTCEREITFDCDLNPIAGPNFIDLAWSNDGTRIALLFSAQLALPAGNLRIFEVTKTTGDCRELCCQQLGQVCSLENIRTQQVAWTGDDCIIATTEKNDIFTEAIVRFFCPSIEYPKNCEIKNNQVTGTQCGIEAIGYLGDCTCLTCTQCGCNNLFIRNVSYNNEIPYRGVFPIVEGADAFTTCDNRNLAFTRICR